MFFDLSELRLRAEEDVLIFSSRPRVEPDAESDEKEEKDEENDDRILAVRRCR